VNENITLPETLTVPDSYYDSLINKFMREGGTYLLPLAYIEEYGTWSLIGDCDVLFEVDDNGLINSHSRYEDFNKFDGKTVDDVAKAITDLVTADGFAFVTGHFARALIYGYVLETVTVVSLEKHDDWSSEYIYTLYSPERGEITVLAQIYEDDLYLEIGGEYLMFLVPIPTTEPMAGLDFEIWEYYSAKIDENNRIVIADTANNAFDGLNGKTTQEVYEIANKIKTWYTT
jgi:hypothetical protein